ncbi:hypothetical protein HU200_025692 [Digitaria exilis]|uniref:Uncharacterized protein n=1 Tax=Digitaria exilis TaxID=1010633 RepID=A0A835C0Y3_9POAL|nr:hypothetical protein HU200_025692 [Digitaria exilis]
MKPLTREAYGGGMCAADDGGWRDPARPRASAMQSADGPEEAKATGEKPRLPRLRHHRPVPHPVVLGSRRLSCPTISISTYYLKRLEERVASACNREAVKPLPSAPPFRSPHLNRTPTFTHLISQPPS